MATHPSILACKISWTEEGGQYCLVVTHIDEDPRPEHGSVTEPLAEWGPCGCQGGRFGILHQEDPLR